MLIVILSLAFRLSHAQDMTITSLVRPNYLGSTGAIFYDGTVSQSDVFFRWENGWYADIWASVSDDAKAEFGDEVDVQIGYSGKYGAFGYSTDLMYIAVYGTDVVNLNTELVFKNMFVRIETYIPAKNNGPQKGLNSSAGLRHSFKLSPMTTITLNEWVKHDTGAFGFESGWLAQGYVGLDFDIAKPGGLSITSGVKWSVPLSVDDRDNEVTPQMGLVYSFRN